MAEQLTIQQVFELIENKDWEKLPKELFNNLREFWLNPAARSVAEFNQEEELIIKSFFEARQSQ